MIMDFALCVSDTYAQYAMVTIKSILENNPKQNCHFHILTKDMHCNTRKQLQDLCSDSWINIIEVDDTILKGLNVGQWQIYTWFRVLLPELLKEVSLVLYLDADTIVVDNIESLFSINMLGKSIAASLDLDTMSEKVYKRCEYAQSKGYICAGVLLMNLDYWRENDLTRKILEMSMIKKYEYADQDAINYLCQDTKIILPLKYDIVYYYLTRPYFRVKMPQECIEMIEHPQIIHYAGLVPWIKEKDKHFFSYLWHYYNHLLPTPAKTYKINKGYRYYVHLLKVILHYWGLSNYNPWYVSTKRINLNSVLKELKEANKSIKI